MITANKKISFRAKFTGFFLIAALAITLIAPIDNAYAQTGNQGNTGNQNTGNQTTAQSGETCAIEKIGWILCPIMEGVAKAADKTYEVLANNFLQIEPELLTANPEGGKGTITAWEYARNLANIAFIVAFLVVIYSQVTGAGLNNYGIKRMLPRLIIAAIAVNISYYICQAMVDLSNIFGYEVKGALTSVANQIGPAVMGADSQATNTQTGSGNLGTLSKITIAVLAVAAVVWIFVGLMGSVGLLILITVITIIIILLLRKAFIVILVVLSPLAFVAYLLPNTEKLFSKWLNMFWQLLMVFPIVALLFGGGQLASTVILVAGSGANSAQSSQQNCSAGSTPNVPQSNNGYTVPCEETVEIGSGNNKKPAGWMLGLVAAGIAIAPLLFVWSVLKGALAAAGAIGGKISGAIEKSRGSATKGAQGAYGKTALGRGQAARKAIKQNYKDQRFAERMSRSGRRGRLTRTVARGLGGNLGMAAGAAAERVGPDNALGRSINATTGILRAQSTKLDANFAGASMKIDEQDTKDAQSLLQSQLRNNRGQQDRYGSTADEDKLANKLNEAIVNGDKAGVQAATNILMSMGGPGRDAIRNAMNGTAGTSNSRGAADFRAHLTQAHSALKATDADVYAAASDGNSRGLTFHRGQGSTYEGLTNDQMSTQSAGSLGSTGATSALNSRTAIVDDRGNRTVVSRGRAILASKAGSEIKGNNRNRFDLP